MESEGDDLISLLPEPVQHHILSLMPIQCAARMSLVSKSWNSLWETLPFLDFAWSFILYSKNKFMNKSRQIEVARKIILNRYQQPIKYIQKLFLKIPDLDELKILNLEVSAELDLLMLVVSDCGIRELSLFNGRGLSYFPSNILLARSINILRLSRFDLMKLSSITIKLPYLQCLHLSCVELSDDVLQKLIGGSPLLETLNLFKIKDLRNLCLDRFPKLKLVMLKELNNLDYLKIEGFPGLEILSVQVQSLSKLHVSTFAFMKKVELFGSFITHDLLDKLTSISESASLEYLSIGGSEELDKIKISIATLKELRLSTLSKLVEAEINSPLLQRFKFIVDRILPNFSFNVSDKFELVLDLWGIQEPLELVEYILCLAPLVKSLHIESKKITLKILYEKNVCRDLSTPCELLQSECWQHSSSEIRIEKFEGSVDYLQNLKNFFHQHVENLKIIEN